MKRTISALLNDDDDDENQQHPSKRKLGPVVDGGEAKPPAVRRLQFPAPTDPAPRTPPFQHPSQLVAFSYSATRVLEFTNAALRYFADPPRGADLSLRYDAWVRRPEERGRLDGLLEACGMEQARRETQRAGVVTWRGVMTKILTAPYEERDACELNVMCVRGTMYIEEHISAVKLQEKENMTPRHRLQSYYGYAFESYCTSSTPDPLHDSTRLENGWGGDVNTNVQWCSVAKTKLGDTRMIIGGEVDCIRGRYTGQPQNFVELKTSLAIRGPQDESKFEKKLLKFYFQSFLLGVPEIVVGFRTPAGHITTLQSFKTIEIPRLVRGKPGAWDPNLCLDWGHRFLTFLKSVVDGSAGIPPTYATNLSSSGDDWRQQQERVWRVKFEALTGVEVSLLDEEGVEEVRNGEDRVGFLPKAYWDRVAGPGGQADKCSDKGVVRTEAPVATLPPNITSSGFIL